MQQKKKDSDASQGEETGQSQFEDLEKPADAITVEIDKAPEAIVSEIIGKLKSSPVAYSDPAQK